MAKKNGFNTFANTALISGGILIFITILAFLFVNGDSLLNRFIIENRSEVFGVGAGIFVVGIVAKINGIRLG